MSKNNSPDGLVIKSAARAGFAGGAVSRKLPGVIGIMLAVLVMFILYIISRKGHHSEKAPEDAVVTEQSGSQDNSGLQSILGTAPAGTVVVEGDPPVAKPVNPGPPVLGVSQPGLDGRESKAQSRVSLADEQAREQLRQQKTQALQAALIAKSAVSIDVNDKQRMGTTVSHAGTMVAPHVSGSAEPPAEDPNKQDVKMAFAKEGHSNTYLMTGREVPVSPHELKVGTLIPATMISGLNSDLPGQVIASVSQNVYDSATGSDLLIPQGSKLYGLYDSQVAYGQDRILVAWTRVNYPDGTTLELKGMGAVDAAGYAGFADQVDHHYWKIFGNSFVLGMITGASEAGVSDSNSDDTSTAEAVNNGVAEQFADTGSTLIEKNLDVQPTITVRSGYKFNIMLNKDASLEPYQPAD